MQMKKSKNVTGIELHEHSIYGNRGEMTTLFNSSKISYITAAIFKPNVSLH